MQVAGSQLRLWLKKDQVRGAVFLCQPPGLHSGSLETRGEEVALSPPGLLCSQGSPRDSQLQGLTSSDGNGSQKKTLGFLLLGREWQGNKGQVRGAPTNLPLSWRAFAAAVVLVVSSEGHLHRLQSICFNDMR